MLANLSSSDLNARFDRAVARIVPRILTQVNRDASAPSYGSFDRNWWHYKIRDFSSIILQQGAYALAEASQLIRYQESRSSLQELARAGAKFWNERAQLRGAFEEYYPWEQGYPPVAFSTLGIAKLVREGLVPAQEVAEGLEVAARQLATRFEGQAGNQQVAGLAALAEVRAIDGSLATEQEFQSQAERTLKLQHQEGWYVEYDGPDLGYLAVTIDCLWDLFDATKDERFLKSAQQGLAFIGQVVDLRGGSAGMLNARNTDYLVPYGLVRFALGGGAEAECARGLVATLYHGLDEPTHFLAAIDDRYLSHYIGHSFVRAARLLSDAQEITFTQPNLVERRAVLPGCGYVLDGTAESRLLIATKKGGVFSWSDRERACEVTDFGWLVKAGEALSFNHWWSNDWKVQPGEEAVKVAGNLYSHRGASSSPFKHFVLRVLSFTFGARIIGWLKSKLIFKNDRGTIRLQRTIQREGNGLKVVDVLEGLPASCEVSRAPRASKRHVSSADSYHREDLALCRGIDRQEEQSREGERLTITTQYRFQQSS